MKSSSLIAKVTANFYTVGEAARVLGISRMTLWHWAKVGKVRVYRLGPAALIEKKAVEALRR